MNVPDLVQRTLDGEEVQTGISIGDEDAVYLTPTRTVVYRGEGLISDERVEEYSHDVERLTVSEGRRKTKFRLQYIEGTESFTVPSGAGEQVLELFLEGVLRREGVVEPEESVDGVYRFSELTLIVAQERLVKLVGEQVWNEDHEVYPFADVTGLEFERGSVATSIVLSVDGRIQRIKVPNDKAPVVRQTLERALFEYYDVGSLEELNRSVGPDPEESTGASDTGEDESGFSFGDDFDPLVSDDRHAASGTADDLTDEGVDGLEAAGESAPVDTHPETGGSDTSDDHGANEAPAAASADEPSDHQSTAETDADGDSESAAESTSPDPLAAESQSGGDDPQADTDAASKPAEEDRSPASADAAGADGEPTQPAVTREEFETVTDRLEDLTEAVERQNELLKRQHKAIKQLIRQSEE